jgi:lipoprotein signal peptidase
MQQSHSNVVVLVIAVGSSVGGGLANFLDILLHESIFEFVSIPFLSI